MELDVGNSTESFQRFLESQKELFHNQIDQLQKIVVTQCKLTGVNPLAQEMAAGALSIKIGKRPRDLLNPKAVKYMQSVFSIKDTINKKETREISALCGVTVTQVRELFAGYRSRVRKLVRLSREKAVKSSTCPLDACSVKPELSAPSSHDVPLNSVDPNNLKEEEPSGSSPEETFPGIDSYEKNFVENIFNLMRKVETFSGQVELMEWVLQIHNTTILNWFLTKGGIMILATWLGLAAIEEQTTVLLVILKVLSHLPLHRALPVQMSAILQTVNKLRFYRTADISNRARVLLSRLSKLFVRSQTVKDAQKEMIRKQRISEILSDESWHSKIDIPEELLALTCGGGSECSSKLEHMPAHSDSNKKSVRGSSINTDTRERRKILMVEQPSRSAGRNVQVARVSPVKQSRPMSADDIQKAKLRALFMQSKYGKTGASSKEISQHKIKNSRVTSARSEIMKVSSLQTSSAVLLGSKTVLLKTESDSKPVSLSSSVSLSEYLLDPKPTVPQESVVQLNSSSPKSSSSPQKQNTIRSSALQNFNVEPSAVSHQPKSKSSVTFAEPDPKSISAPQEDPLLEKLKRDKIPWHTPPEMRINPGWRLGTGENSKEVEVQTERIRRERETIYPNIHGIPSDPKDPWDIEMDYDDSLTPEIPTEQPPDADIVEVNSPCSNITVTAEVNSPCSNTTVTAAASSGAASNADPEPDLELLAVLLNNPDLVFALTSGQRGNISSAEMVQVLDMIKASGVGLAGSVNGVAGNAAEVPRSVISSSLTPLPSPIPMSLPSPTPMSLPSPTPVSLPSPTPHSTVTEWRLGSASTPEVPQMSSHSQSALQVTFGAVSSNPSHTVTPSNSEIHQIPTTISAMRQLPAGFSPSLQTPPATTILPSQTLPTTLWESQSPPVVTLSQLPHDRHNKFSAQRAFNSQLSTVPATVQQISVPQLETRDLGRTNNPKSASASIVVNHPGVDRPITTFTSTPSLFVPPKKQPSLLPEPMAVLPSFSPWSGNAPSIGVREFMPGTSRPNGFLDNRAPNPHAPASQSKYNSYPVGPVQTPLHPGPGREGNEYNTRAPVFETWSSESDQESELDRNFHGQRRDSGRTHIRSEWPRHPRHSGHHRDHRPSNRRWRDRDRRY